MSAAASHIPVMRDAVMAALAPRDGGVYIDASYGGGGHARALLALADARLIAIDRDPEAVERARCHAETDSRLYPVQGRFSRLHDIARSLGMPDIDGVMLDLGVSSFQIDDGARGFSFQKDGPLDMRMEREGMTAAEVVNEMDERELASIIYRLGEEYSARRLTRAIVASRNTRPFTTTQELASLARSHVRVPAGRKRIDPATRMFQALRIYVNDELGELQRGLSASEQIIRPEGRLVILSFHSLEDRIVKTFFRVRSGAVTRPSRHLPEDGTEAGSRPQPSFAQPVRKVVKASSQERAANPRSRSARLRWGIRSHAKVWSASPQPSAGIPLRYS